MDIPRMRGKVADAESEKRIQLPSIIPLGDMGNGYHHHQPAFGCTYCNSIWHLGKEDRICEQRISTGLVTFNSLTLSLPSSFIRFKSLIIVH